MTNSDWDSRVLAAQPEAHFMQSDAWAALKSGSAWKPSRLEIALPTSPSKTFPVQV
ncbi:MAG: hypothetical protein JJE28_09680, partial [Actinomycetales bacterium]|nr:hypothetical protein [Actinomycetales bacterium]